MQVRSDTVAPHTNAPFMSEHDIACVRSEGQRRVLATSTGGSSTLHDGGECTTPFKNPRQAYVLVNMSNQNQRPYSEAPAFRVLGVFESPEDVKMHTETLHAIDPRTKYCNMYMITTHAFYSIPENYNFDMSKQLEGVNQNLLEYHRRMKLTTEEFVKHHDELTKGLTPVQLQNSNSGGSAQQRIDANKQRVQEDEDNDDDKNKNDNNDDDKDTTVVVDKDDCGAVESKQSDNTDMSITDTDQLRRYTHHAPTIVKDATEVASILRSCELRGQNYMSVMVLRDYHGGDREPAINILGAFASEEECVRYNKYVAAKHIEDFDIYTKAMYEWIFPNMAFYQDMDNVEQLYRNEELDRIMRAQRENNKKVEQFENYFTEQEMDIPVTTVEPDLMEPAPQSHRARTFERQ